MNKIRIFSIFCILASCVAVCGCDAFRKLAGRPTSAELSAYAQALEKAELEHSRKIDSLQTLRMDLTDSLALLDSLNSLKSALVATRELDLASCPKLDGKYYIIVGAFRSEDNASILCAKVKKAGYNAAVIPYKNGFFAVGAHPAVEFSAAYAHYKAVRKESFCPADAWILEVI